MLLVFILGRDNNVFRSEIMILRLQEDRVVYDMVGKKVEGTETE